MVYANFDIAEYFASKFLKTNEFKKSCEGNKADSLMATVCSEIFV